MNTSLNACSHLTASYQHFSGLLILDEAREIFCMWKWFDVHRTGLLVFKGKFIQFSILTYSSRYLKCPRLHHFCDAHLLPNADGAHFYSLCSVPSEFSLFLFLSVLRKKNRNLHNLFCIHQELQPNPLSLIIVFSGYTNSYLANINSAL